MPRYSSKYPSIATHPLSAPALVTWRMSDLGQLPSRS
jgi:hypothetical protein